jgi:hypothetical protein
MKLQDGPMCLKITKHRLWALVGSALLNVCVLLSIASARLCYGYLVGDYSSHRYCQMLAKYDDFMRWANSGGRHSGNLPPKTPFYESILEIVYLSSICNFLFLLGLTFLFVSLAGCRVFGVRRFERSMPLLWVLLCLIAALLSNLFLFRPLEEAVLDFGGQFFVSWGRCDG